MAEILGAPVTEPPGNVASSSSVSDTSSRSVPSTRDTRCSTPASGRSVISSGHMTEPVSQTRERSFRSRSTIITCSAASFSDSVSPAPPAGRVPLIGIVQTRRPLRARKTSGEAETIAQPSPTNGRRCSGRSGASLSAKPAGSPRNGAERCWTRFTWYTSPRAIASRTASTAAACSAGDQRLLPLADREASRSRGSSPSGRIRTAAGGSGHGSGGEGSRPRRSAPESPYPR